MAKVPSLSLRVQWLGSRLKKARNEAGYTLDEAGSYLEVTGATVSRFEKGTMKIRRPYLKDLVDFYGISDRRERDVLFQLSEDAWRRDWWDGDTADLEIGFLDYTWLESRSVHIQVFEPLIIHGLLQTRSFTESVMRNVHGAGIPDSELSRLVELRLRRQRILDNSDAPRLTVITEEPAIRRPIGGVNTQREQLRHLLDATHNSNIMIRILPMTAPWDPGFSGPFTYFDMPDPYPHVAFSEGVTGRVFFEEEKRVELFRHTYHELERNALTASRSRRYIHDTLKELE